MDAGADAERGRSLVGHSIDPPVFISGISDLLVTDEARRELRTSGLKRLSEHPVELARVTKVDWQAWDAEAPAAAR